MSVEFFYIGNVFDAVKTGVVGLDAENFIVLFSGINHIKHTDRSYSDDASGGITGRFPKIITSAWSPSSAFVSGMNP